MAEGSIAWDIIARDRASSAFDSAGKSADGMASRVGSAAKAMIGGLAAASVGTFLKGSLDAAAESNKVAAQTEAVLKSTGGAAGISAKQIGDLSHSLQGLSGVSDENIQSGSNMLATFTNIKNGVGENNDIFSQATKTMLDMSVATGGDAKAAAIQLGKALNDPVKGVSALGEVGVTFTEQQKEQIKAMVAVGDTAGAQKVILAELNKEFGGSAKAAGDAMTPMDRLGLAFGDLQETIGLKLLPVIEKVATFLAEHQSLILPLAAVIGGALVAAFAAWAISAGAAAAATIAATAPVILAAAPVIALGAAVAAAAFLIINNWDSITAAVAAALDWIGQNWPLILAILTGPIGLAVLAIVRNWDAIKDGVTKVKDWIVDRWNEVVGFVTGLPGRIATAAAGMWDGIKDAFKGAINWVIEKWNGLGFKLDGPFGFSVDFGPKYDSFLRIPPLANGVRDFAGGLALVGERGPELVNLPRGADVFSNRDSQQMAGGLVVNVHGMVDEAAARRLAVVVAREQTFTMAGRR